MTDEKTIGELTPVVTLLPAALIEIEQTGASFNATIQQVMDLVPPSGVQSINADVTAAQIIAAGTGLGIVDAGATHTLAIDATVVTLTGAQILTNKTIDSFTNINHADTEHMQVRNESGLTITRGTVVHISGFDVPTDLPLILAADSSSSATMPAIGIVTSDIADTANGDVTLTGVLANMVTTGFSIGDTVYVSETPGEFTNVKPTGTALIQNIGHVLKVGGIGVGRLKVTSIDRVNDIPNIASANFWLGDATGVPTAVTMSGDVTMDNAGVTSIGTNKVTNDDIIAHTSTKITITAKGQLNGAIVYNDQNNSLGAFYVDIDDIAVPANPGGGARRIFVDTATGELSVRTNGGATVSLETQGAPLTPWTENIDAAEFNLTNVGLLNLKIDNTTAVLELEANHTTPDEKIIGQIDFIDDDNLGARATYTQITSKVKDPISTSKDAEFTLSAMSANVMFDYVQLNSGGNEFLILDVPLNSSIFLQINGGTEYSFASTQANFQGNNVLGLGTISFASSSTSIQQATTDMQLDVATGGAIVHRVNNVAEYDFDATQADFNGNNIIDLGDVTLADSSNIILNATTGTKIGTATSQKIGFWNTTPVVQPTALTTQDTSITHTAPGTPDFAIQDLTSTSPFGFVTKDEGNTVLQVILNLQTRVAELESKLQAVGVLG